MTVYLDTSSLIELFVEETGSDLVRAQIEGALVTTSIVAYAEARAVLARRRCEAVLTARAFATAKHAFETWWVSVVAIEVSAAIARSAGDLAEQFRLRAVDGVHLATFATVATDRRLDAVTVSSFDEALNRAAGRWLRQAQRTIRRRPARS